MKKARELGWQNVLSNSYENKDDDLSPVDLSPLNKVQPKELPINKNIEVNKTPSPDNPSYQNYFQQLDQCNVKLKEREKAMAEKGMKSL
jgi:hypothetical protein